MSNEAEKTKAIVKIAGLLARGQSDFGPEAATAVGIAMQLMKKYGITFSDIAQHDLKTKGEYARALPDPEDVARIVDEVLHVEAQDNGRKGGLRRASKMTPEQRTASAQKAARKRWGIGEKR